MTRDKAALPGTGGAVIDLDTDVLGFVAQMYGVQLDQLAALLADRGEPAESATDRARAAVSHWRDLGCADTGQLSVGEPWIWVTQRGFDALGLQSRGARPALSLLRHIHAVTEVRLAVERTSEYRDGGASWRSERDIRACMGGASAEEHVPDGEVCWPADCDSPWAGEIWDVEVELSRKVVDRNSGIMREALARTGEYGCPPASIAVPGQPPRYPRLVYVCARAAVQTVLNARAQLPAALSARIEVYDLPASATRLNTPKRGW